MYYGVVFLFLIVSAQGDYFADRDAFIKEEASEMLGGSIQLTEKEEKVNRILMQYKFREMDAGFQNPRNFAPSQHFFQARRLIDNSNVFKLIQTIPKGALLHGHDVCLVSSDYLYALTYRENLYACTVNGRLRMKFFESGRQDNTCNWNLINVLRIIDPSYDRWLRSQINLYTTHPKQRYPNINDVWETFESIIFSVLELLTYRPVFEEYFYQVLQDLYDDNVMYMDFRGFLPSLYELNGTIYQPLETIRFYEETIEKFKRDHPKFLGARLIYSPRKDDNATMSSSITVAKEARKTNPKFVAGFDLVGQEDARYPIIAYLNELKELQALGMDFFFHAGETNWFDTKTDFNLIDAILLGTKRIGHGYAITKHPKVMKLVKERQIAIEVCPISNQVLMLVDDMRNHPAATLIANGFPVVISNDDPTFWGAKGLSYDFYMAFMGIAGRTADLRLLKQFALNSLTYSSLPADEKRAAIASWEKDWQNFIDITISSYANEIPH
ncbi:hypothetical protein RI129_011289 [Pyrocoelia pectoralis]|uniref:Adenosine deaminase n=1 Tax=Pyrocoelia pectoralis TaxID=417401 RepID=A0AAN7ZIM8_9COLE